MNSSEIALTRLLNQKVVGEKYESPDQVVSRFGAMQAQDFNSVKWALSVRTLNGTNKKIEQAFNDKLVIRTWLLRGTLHIAAPSDLSWMISLISPRLIRGSAGRNRQLGLDEDTIFRSLRTLTKALAGRQQLTRKELMSVLNQNGISTEGQRGYHILWRAAMEKILCFGPMHGSQQTFMLLDEFITEKRSLNREESIVELAARYIRSHGPATMKDFSFWSGLTTTDAKTGFENNKDDMLQEEIDGQIFWQYENSLIPGGQTPEVFLLPAFDEYFLAYKTRNIVLDPKFEKQAVSSNGIFRPIVVIDGQIAGIWKHQQRKNSVTLSFDLFRKLTKVENKALNLASNQYGAFLEKTVQISNIQNDQ